MKSKNVFAEERGKVWNQLTKEDKNEYYRLYYSENKERIRDLRRQNTKRCEICDVDVQNIYIHNNSHSHQTIVKHIERIEQKYKI